MTITAVAQRAGVGRPTVYRRYVDGADLLRAALFHDLERLFAALPTPGQPPGPVLDEMIAQARPFLEYYAREPAISRALLQQSVFGERPVPAHLAALNYQYILRLAGVLDAAKATGEVAADADTLMGAASFFALYLSAVMAGLADPLIDVTAQEMLLRRTFGQHLDGLRPTR